MAQSVTRYLTALLPRSLVDIAPGAATIRRYDRSLLRGDLIAGTTVGLVAVPSSLAMAELAGLPVVYGLYGTLFPLAVYGLLATSRQHVIGPDATLASLTAVTIGPLAVVNGVADPARFAALAAGLALLMGALLFLAGTLRLGFVSEFFGKPVLLGYINGVALTVIASQFGKLLGVDIDATDFFAILREAVREAEEANGATVLLSGLLLMLGLAVRRVLPIVPASLVVLGVGLLLGWLAELEDRDITIVGEVEGGLPPVAVPNVGIGDYVDLLLPAAAFALVALADTIATVRTFAQAHGYQIDANRELTALGGANLIGGLTSAFPVSSSNSRSAVNDATGARSQLAVVAAAVVVAIFVLFAMPLIEPLPKAALGVIIVIAALGLINVRSVWRLRRVRTAEVVLAAAAFLGVLLLGVIGGVGVAIALSIGVFLYRSARPHDAVLGETSDADGYHDVDRWPTAQAEPGLVVYRFDAALFFVNAEYFRLRALAVVDAANPPAEWLVVNAESFTYIDSTAVDVLRQLHGELAARGTRLCIARLKGRQREIFAETGLTALIGPESFFPTIRSSAAAFGRRHEGGS